MTQVKSDGFYYSNPLWKTHEELQRVRNTLRNMYLDMKKYEIRPPMLLLNKLKPTK